MLYKQIACEKSMLRLHLANEVRLKSLWPVVDLIVRRYRRYVNLLLMNIFLFHKNYWELLRVYCEWLMDINLANRTSEKMEHCVKKQEAKKHTDGLFVSWINQEGVPMPKYIFRHLRWLSGGRWHKYAWPRFTEKIFLYFFF